MTNRCALVFLSLVLLVGCRAGSEGGATLNPPAKDPELAVSDADAGSLRQEPAGPLPDPLVPRIAQTHGPSMSRLVPGETFDGDVLVDVESCGRCHAEVLKQWKGSMHHRSSFNNPFYQQVFDSFVADNGKERGRFCGGCHDTALMFDDAILATVAPDNRRAHAGISCGVCHGVTEATTEGNGSYTLTTSAIPVPAGDTDAEGLKAHLSRVGSPALRTNALCASCHIGFINSSTGHAAVVNGLNEFSPFRISGFNGSKASRLDAVDKKSCVDCHMPVVTLPDGKKIRSHRFAGGHSTMAALASDREQLEAIEALVKSAARLDIIAIGEGLGRPAVADGEGELEAGGELLFDVVIVNEGAGHKFPGGALDLRDTWLEVELRDATGELLAQAGAAHEKSGADPSAHRLRALVVTKEGTSVLDHRVSSFRTPAFDNSIGPRGAVVVRYAWSAPKELDALQLPVEARVRLRHRRLGRSLQEATCEASRAGRGKAFIRENAKLTGVRLDPCKGQPVIDLEEVRSAFGAGAGAWFETNGPPDQSPWWIREYYRGLGLEAQVQERLQEAQRAFEGALASLGEGGESRSRARVLLELARVKARQGRTEEAAGLIKEVDAIVGENPASALALGEAYARVWRWEEAAAAFEVAARLAPDDDRTWRQLAIAQGSVGNHRRSLEAAQRGLGLEPRDPHMLRSQMLAMQRLAPEDPRTEQAREAFLAFKRDEEAPSIQSACGDASAECWLERLPVHTHELKGE